VLPGIVAGKCTLHITFEITQKPAQIGHPATDVLFRVPGIFDTETPGRGRHELHQPLGTLLGDGITVEPRFGLDDRLDQIGIYIVTLTPIVDLLVVADIFIRSS